MKDPLSESQQLYSPLHAGVLPDDDLIVDVSVAGHQLPVLSSPHQAAYLGVSVDFINIFSHKVSSPKSQIEPFPSN